MGWFYEDTPGHEGYLVGVVRDGEWRWRELGTDADQARADAAPGRKIDVGMVQVACECGWRSQRMVAPLGAYWWPCIISFAHDDEVWSDAASEIWRDQHIRLVRSARERSGGDERSDQLLLFDVNQRLRNATIRYRCTDCDNAGKMRRGELRSDRRCWRRPREGTQCAGRLTWQHVELEERSGGAA